jgi:hypothetical protein
MKKVMVSILSLAALGTTLAAPLMANAFEIKIGEHRFSDRYGYRSDYRYVVYFRKHSYDSWKVKGDYGSRFEAEHALHKLQDKGYYARIDRYSR